MRTLTLKYLRSTRFLLATTIVASAAITTILVVRPQNDKERLSEGIRTAACLLREGREDDAWKEIQKLKAESSSTIAPEFTQALNTVAVATSSARNDYVGLRAQFNSTPESFDVDEAAAQQLARLLLEEKLDKLLAHWSSRRTLNDSWFLLDVDILLKRGQRDEAKTLLESTTLQGSADCNRLARLALLEAATDLNRSWTLLEEALRVDPRNSDVRTFRAQILEATGQTASARVEYVAAFVADPDNSVTCLHLGDFYCRQYQYEMAIQTWNQGLSSPSLGTIWLRTLFWTSVTRSKVERSFPVEIPNGELKDLIAFLRTLPDSVFWDDSQFDAVPQCDVYRAEVEEVAWLRLLESLRTGDNSKALEILTQWSGRFTLNTDLANCIHRIVDLRLSKSTSSRLSFDESISSDIHPLFRAVNLVILNNETRTSNRETILQEIAVDANDPGALLSRPDVFAAACIAGGWCEAALKLRLPGQCREDGLPDWWSFGIAQCLRFNRSDADAINFIDQQGNSSVVLNVLKADCLLAQGQRSEAMHILQTYAHAPSASGYRAAWIFSTLLLEEGKTKESKRVLENQPLLSEATEGKELLARIKLAEGDSAGAKAIYVSLGTNSTEGLAFLARQAFALNDFVNARMLTTELLKKMPDQLQLLANLKAIDDAENGRTTSL